MGRTPIPVSYTHLAQRETEPLSIHVRAFETDDGLEIIVELNGEPHEPAPLTA